MSEKLTVLVDGKSRELFMSFGMLNELARYIGSVEAIGTLSLDPNLRSIVLKILLSERDSNGVIPDGAEFNLMTSDLSIAEVTVILDWVTEHLLDFTMSALQSAKSLQDKIAPKVHALTSSSAGSAP